MNQKDRFQVLKCANPTGARLADATNVIVTVEYRAPYFGVTAAWHNAPFPPASSDSPEFWNRTDLTLEKCAELCQTFRPALGLAGRYCNYVERTSSYYVVNPSKSCRLYSPYSCADTDYQGYDPSADLNVYGESLIQAKAGFCQSQ